MLRDTRQHLGADLVAIMECEYVVGPSVAREGFVGTGLPLEPPANAEEAASTRRARVEGQAATNETRSGES